jgi:hypothetical protein
MVASLTLFKRVLVMFTEMVIVMTVLRKRVYIQRSFMELQGKILGWVVASDGVWVPRCDLKQYESGNRPFSE